MKNLCPLLPDIRPTVCCTGEIAAYTVKNDIWGADNAVGRFPTAAQDEFCLQCGQFFNSFVAGTTMEIKHSFHAHPPPINHQKLHG